jgi:hypothetical protein
MKPHVCVEFEGASKDDDYIITRSANKVLNLIAQKHEFKRETITITVAPSNKGNYADLQTGRVHIDTASDMLRKALRGNAIDGLLAHEVMHLALLDCGEDALVTKAASKAVGAREERILGICEGYGGGKYCKDAVQVMVTLGLVLKDLLNDDAVIKVGLGKELYEYYMSTVTTKLEAEKRGLGELGSEEVENLFIAVIGVMPAWVSFYRNGMPEEGAHIRGELFKRFADIPTPLRLAVNRLSDRMVRVNPVDEKSVDELVGMVLDAFEEVLSKKSAEDGKPAE